MGTLAEALKATRSRSVSGSRRASRKDPGGGGQSTAAGRPPVDVQYAAIKGPGGREFETRPVIRMQGACPEEMREILGQDKMNQEVCRRENHVGGSQGINTPIAGRLPVEVPAIPEAEQHVVHRTDLDQGAVREDGGEGAAQEGKGIPVHLVGLEPLGEEPPRIQSFAHQAEEFQGIEVGQAGHPGI